MFVDHIFHTLIIKHHQFDKAQENIDVQFNYEEQNALRYTAGYVTEALIKKLKRSAHPLKEEMVCCLLELQEAKEDVSEHESQDWMRAIDRGGLKHIGNMTFGVFSSIELEIRQHIRQDSTVVENIKPELQRKISSNDDVLFFWSLVSANWEEGESQALLEQIIDHYITVRGFSFASGWMEKYKQAQKKGTQKSKGIRKQQYVC